jgi:hypothetical protein
VDGGHIPAKAQDKRSFEALSAIVYRPSCLERVDLHHQRITDKSCVVSALDDDLKTIKTYLHHAALKQGLTVQTKVTALADGANNCWSVLLSLKPDCQTLECILDWFRIVKKFQNVKNALGGIFNEAIESAKWYGTEIQHRLSEKLPSSETTSQMRRTVLSFNDCMMILSTI